MLATSNELVPVAQVVNNTALPPGRICGQLWLYCPFCNSVTGAGAPPAERIRDKPPMLPSAAMMLPSSPQLPPRPPTEPHKVIAEPPSTEIFLRLDPLKKATHCPSGEKKGSYAPCVPASSVALGSSSRRVKRRFCDTYTSRVPSGERIVSVPSGEPSDTSGPRSTSSRTSGLSACSIGRVERHQPNNATTAMIASAAATAHGNLLVEAGAACVAPESFGAAIASSISIRTSAASWSR